tara:strand:+ start:391 stop:510 length:120 start_codon:yes stop_codon:yes gene_type:complete
MSNSKKGAIVGQILKGLVTLATLAIGGKKAHTIWKSKKK